MDYKDFYYLLNEEIKDILINSKDMKETAEERKKLSLTILKNRTLRILYGDNARRYAEENDIVLPSQETKENVSELKGITGSQGYAVGKVRVIEGAKEMHNFRQGEILVATMTTPDFIPIMSKAKAIVTNEGGITCHAAILAREMNKPCIIGTEIATKVFNDGDLVEVDADNGIVRKL
jgi:phosphoenolpyruvate synthase/pyruvate phosphate dikinase